MSVLEGFTLVLVVGILMLLEIAVRAFWHTKGKGMVTGMRSALYAVISPILGVLMGLLYILGSMLLVSIPIILLLVCIKIIQLILILVF